MTESSPYLRLKLARELYQKSPDQLGADEQARIATVAARQTRIEQAILGSREATQVILPASSVAAAVAEIRGRYGDEAEYRADLARAGLDPEALRAAIARDLKVEAVLEKVGAGATAVSATEVEIFYLQHAARFHQPETRTLSHLLITIDASRRDGTRAVALAHIEAIRARIDQSAERFKTEAQQHSECPTALQGGRLGTLAAGKLYAELDARAFALAQGEISEVVESPLGFHLLLCEEICAARIVPLAEAAPGIHTHQQDARIRLVQKRWLAALMATAGPQPDQANPAPSMDTAEGGL